MSNPAGAHGGKGALSLPGHFPVGEFTQQNIFLRPPRTTFGITASNAQFATLHFDRAYGMTGAGGHFCVREFAQ
jgi:hypothetical protein